MPYTYNMDILQYVPYAQTHYRMTWTTSPLCLSTAGEADVGVAHQRQLRHYLYGAGECINGTVSALERLKCKIYEVSIQIEWFLVVI